MTEQTLASRLTPEIPAGIATIAIRGPDAIRILRDTVQLRTQRILVGNIHFGELIFPSRAQHTIGEASTDSVEHVVICRTGDEQVEVHCHGGNAICQAVLARLADAGCVVVSAEDWPSELCCPISRDAERALIRASTDRAAAVLIDQLNGSLASAIQTAIAAVTSKQFATASKILSDLKQFSELGLHLIDPWRIVLAGPPNVGKSSLINAIVGQARSIVHHEPGTTRDWLESGAVIDGWPVTLTDTAGIRHANDAIEAEGVARAKQQVATADLLLLVVDATVGWTDTHERLAQSEVPRKLVAWNKVDLVDEFPVDTAGFHAGPAIPVVPSSHAAMGSDTVEPSMSLLPNAGGITHLTDRIVKLLIPRVPEPAMPVPFTALQVANIEAALRQLERQESDACVATLCGMLAHE